MQAQDAGDNAPLDMAAIRHGLRDIELGSPLIYLPEVNSTNTYAADLARSGAPEGAIIFTDHQTAGRGRAGRSWKPLPNQQLILSIVLRPAFPAHFLVMASAVAVAEAIEEALASWGGAQVTIKWPNDVLVNGRKVCGVLIETSDSTAILGMGINVNGALDDPELAARATTLAAEIGGSLEREPLAINLISRLDTLYRALNAGGASAQSELRDRWRARLATLGQRVTIRQTPSLGKLLEGFAEDVDQDGALLLRLDDGNLRPITWGDVESAG
jgi:BirA family biotin operon repressor/biotin-[acetyl-CoA-carboxylase] ligase